jgi:hypothetical protein
MADYAYAFKAPPQYYISPSSSSNPNLSTNGGNTGTSNTNNPIAPPTALLWTDLEPWMDAEYARQVCALMRWDAGVLVPPHNTNGFSSNAASGANATHPNNAGYAVLSFASAGAAAAALAQVGVCLFFSRSLLSSSSFSFGAHISRLPRWARTNAKPMGAWGRV